MLVNSQVTPQNGRLQRLSPVPANTPKDVAPQDGFTPGLGTPEVSLKQPEICADPSPDKGLGGWQKAFLAGTLGITAFTGLAPSAQAAMALVHTQPRSQTNGMEVVVLPSGTPRLDIFQAGKYGIDRDVSPSDYSQVGLSLGNGLFQDVEGNLSVIPFLSYNWNLEAKEFRRVDVGDKGQNVQRFGHTVQFEESSTKRDIYAEKEKSVTLTGPHGTTVFERQSDGSLLVKTPHDDQYTIKSEGMFVRISQEGKADINILRAGDEIRVMEGQRTFAGSSLKDGVITLKTQHGEATVTRSESGTITHVSGKKGIKDADIIRDGNTFMGIKDRDRMSVNDRAMLEQAEARYDEVMAQLEQVEPGFEANHPLIAEVLQYASANPRLLTKDGGNTGFLQAGTMLSTTGGAAETMSALGSQAAAINLANSARALGAAALAAKAAAQAQAIAGNMAQAAQLGQQAQELATKAHAAKDAAVNTGGKAMQSATLARVLVGVGGALQIVDGVLGYKGGKSDRALVEGARAVTQSSMDDLSSHMQGPEDRLAVQDDYDKVMKVMDQLDKQADKKILVGKLKIGLGGLMVVSALLGPEAPVLLGAIGIAGTVGTGVYEHWGPIKSFLTGESNKVPTFLDILPKSDEVIIHLDGKPIKK